VSRVGIHSLSRRSIAPPGRELSKLPKRCERKPRRGVGSSESLTNSPPQQEEGGCTIKKSREASLVRADGVVWSRISYNTTPAFGHPSSC